ncbi:hypothetical protein [Sphingobacterium humi]|uniref:hypothetical protein n=1 Tax=Sphingobacterium humi TaxID=1796905 RepID=UPI001BAEB244|nr:hypothetical protein [Sphingobacterium humi]
MPTILYNYLLLIGFFPILIKHFNNNGLSILAKQFNNALFTRQVMLYMIKEYKRSNDKISELIKNGNRILLKRGLYIPGRNIDLTAPEPFLIANYLWGQVMYHLKLLFPIGTLYLSASLK